MARERWKIFGYDTTLVIVIFLYPSICFALYQDTKEILPLYYFILACILGILLGFLLIIKVVRPIFDYLDDKIEKIWGISR